MVSDGNSVSGSSHDFGFERGDRVLVRHRERGNSGNIVAKFEAEVIDFREGVVGGSDKVRLQLPWGDSTTMASYEAEFEVLSS